MLLANASHRRTRRRRRRRNERPLLCCNCNRRRRHHWHYHWLLLLLLHSRLSPGRRIKWRWSSFQSITRRLESRPLGTRTASPLLVKLCASHIRTTFIKKNQYPPSTQCVQSLINFFLAEFFETTKKNPSEKMRMKLLLVHSMVSFSRCIFFSRSISIVSR